jgi:hypothetical protein
VSSRPSSRSYQAFLAAGCWRALARRIVGQQGRLLPSDQPVASVDRCSASCLPPNRAADVRVPLPDRNLLSRRPQVRARRPGSTRSWRRAPAHHAAGPRGSPRARSACRRRESPGDTRRRRRTDRFRSRTHAPTRRERASQHGRLRGHGHPGAIRRVPALGARVQRVPAAGHRRATRQSPMRCVDARDRVRGSG